MADEPGVDRSELREIPRTVCTLRLGAEPARQPGQGSKFNCWVNVVKIENVEIDDTIDCLVVTSDAHAAAEALAGFEQSAATLPGTWKMLFAGDVLGGGIDAVETVDWVRAHAEGRAVRGNHDECIVPKPQPGESHCPGSRWHASGELSDAGYRFVQELPDQVHVCWRGKKIRMIHGDMEPDGEQPVPWLITSKELTDIFGDPQFDLTVTGHTHHPFVRREGDRYLANAGSIAWPFVATVMEDGSTHSWAGDDAVVDSSNCRSSYLVVTEKEAELAVEIVRFDYDREALLDKLAVTEQPIEFWRLLLTTGVVNLQMLKSSC